MTTKALREGWEAGQRAWPDVVLAEDAFSSYVSLHGAQALDDPEASARKKSVRWEDLYLACACSQGDAAALAAFDVAFLGTIDAAVARVLPGSGERDELRQILRHKLFVADGGRAPKIVEYSGRGELQAWVRIVAVRTALNAVAHARREVPFESRAFTFLVGGGDDPEVQYFKRLYAEEFRAAFADALAHLDERERSLLRYAFHEGLSVEAIGALYHVHRATAARWVVKAHARLITTVKRELGARLGVGSDEVRSILRLIESQVEVTLERYLAPT
jgi:RNA polymerase sigma-70 factor (ECF subfamily)